MTRAGANRYWDEVEARIAAEAEVARLRTALEPFAAYWAWRIAEGIKTSPPPLGPAELEAAYGALRVVDGTPG